MHHYQAANTLSTPAHAALRTSNSHMDNNCSYDRTRGTARLFLFFLNKCHVVGCENAQNHHLLSHRNISINILFYILVISSYYVRNFYKNIADNQGKSWFRSSHPSQYCKKLILQTGSTVPAMLDHELTANCYSNPHLLHLFSALSI